MEIIRCKTSENVVDVVLNLLVQAHKDFQRRLRVFLPAGNTPKPLYESMRNNKAFWSKVLEPIQIDEFQKGEVFSKQLIDELVSPLGLEDHFHKIPKEFVAKDFEDHMQEILSEPIDVSLLGLGPNGHVGFHEPGVGDLSFKGGALKISDTSFQRVEGAPSVDVFSFGAGAFNQAESVIIMVTGKNKKDILNRFIESDPHPDLPASLLKDHPNLIVVTDIFEN